MISACDLIVLIKTLTDCRSAIFCRGHARRTAERGQRQERRLRRAPALSSKVTEFPPQTRRIEIADLSRPRATRLRAHQSLTQRL